MAEQLQAEGQDLQLFRDECLGSGAYGKVCKAKLNELPCAAKLLHAILFELDDPQSPTIHHRFCARMSTFADGKAPQCSAIPWCNTRPTLWPTYSPYGVARWKSHRLPRAF